MQTFKRYRDKNGQPLIASGKVSRNALCPCGSGKKNKKCCGDTNRGFVTKNVNSVKVPERLNALIALMVHTVKNPPNGKTSGEMMVATRTFLDDCKVETCMELPPEKWDEFETFIHCISKPKRGRPRKSYPGLDGRTPVIVDATNETKPEYINIGDANNG